MVLIVVTLLYMFLLPRWLPCKKIDQTYIGVGLLAVDLSQNNLGGPVPPELQSLTSLALFNGRNNMMSGNVPAWLGTLSRLQVSEQEEIWARLTTILTPLSSVSMHCNAYIFLVRY